MIGTLLTLFAIGLVALIALGIVLSILGVVFSIAIGIGTFLLFKVAPIVFLGWIVLKLVDRGKSRRGISAADREWLESGS
jgi:hypothetical protein